MKARIKRVLSICIALLVLTAAVSTAAADTAFAEGEKRKYSQGGIEYSLDSTTRSAEAVSGQASKGVIAIPDKISADGVEYSVTSVGSSAFAMQNYSQISIGANVTAIESNAFGLSYGVVSQIEFRGSVCSSIADDAFYWMSFADDFQLIVNGTEDCMDGLLGSISDLADSGAPENIIYVTPDAGEAASRLQERINNAAVGEICTIEVTEEIGLERSITIPQGKSIALTDDGRSHTISVLPGRDVEELLRIEKDASLSLDGELILKGGMTRSNDKGNIADVSGKLYLKNGVLKDGRIGQLENIETGREEITASRSAAVLLREGARFEMSGGSIEGFSLYGDTLTAPVIVGSRAEFVMSGGTISGNKNYTGDNAAGAVLVYSWNGDPQAKMELSGAAEIKDNFSYAGGGGIYLVGNTDLTMTGGSICSNSAKGKHGGGVCVAGANGGAKSADDVTAFTMTGGSICNNSSANTGGGIYVNSNYVSLRGGLIKKNTAATHGGGIYVSKPPYRLQIYDALIKANTASVMGGGLWFCPTGEAILNVTDGAAVYGNSAEGAGDDFVSLGSESGRATLADRALGGGRVEWFSDGAVSVNNTAIGLEWMQTGEVDTSAARFMPESPGEAVSVKNSDKKLALKARLSDNAARAAEAQAKLLITDNKACRGGGIASNGAVVMGVENKDYRLRITKKWQDELSEALVGELELYLQIGGYRLDSVKLKRDNTWTAELTQLPDPESIEGSAKYAIVEEPVPDGFIAVYKEAEVDKDNALISLEVENIRQTPDRPTGRKTEDKEVPTEPSEPSKPSGTEQEEAPEQAERGDVPEPAEDGDSAEVEEAEPKAEEPPKTGDGRKLCCRLILAALSLLATLAALAVTKPANKDVR